MSSDAASTTSGPDRSADRRAAVRAASAACPRPAARATPEQLAAAYERSWRLLWYVAGGVLGGRDGVEDVLQDAVMVALRRLDEFDPATSWEPWLVTIVRYTALNHARRAGRRRARGSDALRGVAASSVRAADGRGVRPGQDRRGAATARGELRGDQDHLDDEMVRALGELGETARACLLLHVLGGLAHREVARVLDIPEGTAMSHVSRARMRLRTALGEDRRPVEDADD